MGWTPAQLLSTTYSDYQSAMDGFNASRSGKRQSTAESIRDGLALARKHELKRRKRARRKAEGRK